MDITKKRTQINIIQHFLIIKFPRVYRQAILIKLCTIKLACCQGLKLGNITWLINLQTHWLSGRARQERKLAQGHDLQSVSTVRFFKFPLYARVHWSYALYLLSNKSKKYLSPFEFNVANCHNVMVQIPSESVLKRLLIVVQLT